MMALLALAALAAAPAASPPDAFAEPIAAVGTCLDAVGPNATDDARLAAAGWTQSSIAKQAPGGAAGNRLFVKEGAGVTILIKVDPASGTHHCHAVLHRSAAEIDALVRALAAHFGGGSFSLDPKQTMFEVPGRNVIVSLRRKRDKGGILADIHTMAFELPEESE